MDGKVLKLNSAYMPLGIISWQDAISDWVAGKLEIIAEYDDKILNERSVKGTVKSLLYTSYKHAIDCDTWSGAMKMPAVVRFLQFVSPPKSIHFYKSFSRKNVYERDEGKCQYCGIDLSLSDMTFDHVVPRARGGETKWHNIVCSCVSCNSSKDDKPLKDFGKRLIKEPVAPKISSSFHGGIMEKLKRIPNIANNEKWLSYMYWNTELKE
jgi:5-methylcytosine-specific restriction endonuclease McrA